MKAFRIAILALAAMGWAVAQDVPPPPKPADEGPSLEATMKFLQDKLPGQVNYIVYVHDNLAGTDGTESRSDGTSSVYADAGHCRVGYHGRHTVDGASVAEGDQRVLLKQVEDITVMPVEQQLQQASAKAGHPERSSKIEPTVFVLLVNISGGGVHEFNFYDETLCHRVAKALQHAVELCGGGSKEPF